MAVIAGARERLRHGYAVDIYTFSRTTDPIDRISYNLLQYCPTLRYECPTQPGLILASPISCATAH